MKLVKAVRILPQQSQLVTVQVEQEPDTEQEPGQDQVLLVEPSSKLVEDECGLCFQEALVKLSPERLAQVPVANLSGITQKLRMGYHIGHAVGVTVVAKQDIIADGAQTNPSELSNIANVATVKSISPGDPIPTSSGTAERKNKLASMIAEVGPMLKWQDRDALHQLLLDKHPAFAVEDGEYGSTDLIEMSIETGDATPVRQPLRRTPFAA